ncbi:MAG: hypothetical protein HUJ69_01780 [Lachnospiraceae bacterium]|nr:hypothetical protein [Lachnospiraceae bacterium]
MAILHMDIESAAMGRTVTLSAYVPSEALKEGETCKTLYLLHGVQGSYMNWLTATNLFRMTASHNATCVDSSKNGSAEKQGKRLAIIIPSAGNGFYHQIPHGEDPVWQVPFAHKHDYQRFFGEELVELTRNLLPLSRLREDTAIAGLSMGGYGALRTALLYPETFGFAGGLSNALITRYADEARTSFYNSDEVLQVIFGDFQKAKTDPKEDVELMFRKALEAGTTLPRVYLACGEQDPLRPLSVNLHRALESMGIPHEYEEHPGSHEWAFWEWGLGRILERL